MKRTLRAFLLLALFAGAGWETGKLLCEWPAAKPLLARLLGREPAALALDNLARVSAGEIISDAVIDREFDLLRHELADESAFEKAVEASRSSVAVLRTTLAGHLRARQWIENQIAAELTVTEEECREYYTSSLDRFAQPERFRASHLFLAAPSGTSPEVLLAKRTLIQGLAIRILAGESFTVLVREASEDEATKGRGGDLGYFSLSRMPPEFMEEVEKLRIGERSAPVQSRLGFHVLQLTDRKPAGQLTFDEAKAEIGNAGASVKRAAAVGQLMELLQTVDYVR